jgi:hypothetical protein
MGCRVKIVSYLIYILCFGSAAFAGKSMQVYAGLNNINYKLDSDILRVSQSSKSSPMFSLVYEDRTDANDQLTRFSFDRLSQTLDTPSNLTPQSINYDLTRIQVSHLAAQSFDFIDKSVMVGFGYSFLQNKAGVTSPNVLIVDSEIHAVDLLAEYEVLHQDDYQLNLLFNLGLPFYKKEYTTTSGSNANSMYLSAGYNLQKRVNAEWSLFQTGEYFVQKNDFVGTGSRGTLNASETLQIYNLLIGVGYEF